MSFRTIFFLLITLLNNIPLVGQTGVDGIDKLKSRFENAKYGALTHTSTYQFLLDNSTGIGVMNYESEELVAIQNNQNIVKRVFYDDNSTVRSCILRDTKGKKIIPDQFCGHYEIESIFYSDAQMCAYKFNISNAGDVASFESAKVISDPKYLTTVFFHEENPVLNRKIVFEIPDDVEVEILEFNFDGFDILKIKSYNEKKKLTTVEYTVTGLEELTKEDHSEGMFRIYPHLLVLTKSYKQSNITFKVLSSTDDLYEWYKNLVNQVDNDENILKPVVDDIIKDCDTDEEKVKAIYYWVQDNIKYIAYENGLAGFEPEPADKVYYNKYGDCKGMANLTKTMLNIAGFDARLSWIGTNIIPYTYDVPSLAVDNHMICTLIHENNNLYLDATEKHLDYGIYSERIQGKQILIEDGDNYLIDLIPTLNTSVNQINRKEYLLIDDGKISGKGTLSVSGQSKQEILFVQDAIDNDKKIKLYQYMVARESIDPDHFNIIKEPVADRDEDFEIVYEYISDDNLTAFGNELYISIDHIKDHQNLSMDTSRVSGYMLDNKSINRSYFSLKIPADYEVSHLPEAYTFIHEKYQFQISYAVEDNTIIYTKVIEYKDNLIEKKEFEEWNKHIDALNEFYSDQIILTKK